MLTKQSSLNKFYCFKIVKELLKTILHVELANWNLYNHQADTAQHKKQLKC